MIRIPEDGLLYHGSYKTVAAPDLSVCRSGLDFGRGFYLTSSMEQAASFVSMSVKKALRRGVFNEPCGGFVSVFRFVPDPNLFIHTFDEADEEWLHFVACNRNPALFRELYKKFASVDIVGGKIANDRTAVTLNNYVSGAFGEPGSSAADSTALRLLEPDRLEDQFCFRTAESISSLVFIRSIPNGSK